jgi:hypothetical protein
MLRLTLRAQEIIEAILDGQQLEGVTLQGLMGGYRWGGSKGSLPAGVPPKPSIQVRRR